MPVDVVEFSGDAVSEVGCTEPVDGDGAAGGGVNDAGRSVYDVIVRAGLFGVRPDLFLAARRTRFLWSGWVNLAKPFARQ